jgi:hypothetical protein
VNGHGEEQCVIIALLDTAESDNEVVIEDDELDQPGVLRRGRSFREYLEQPREEIVLTTENDDSDKEALHAIVPNSKVSWPYHDSAPTIGRYYCLSHCLPRGTLYVYYVYVHMYRIRNVTGSTRLPSSKISNAKPTGMWHSVVSALPKRPHRTYEHLKTRSKLR